MVQKHQNTYLLLIFLSFTFYIETVIAVDDYQMDSTRQKAKRLGSEVAFLKQKATELAEHNPGFQNEALKLREDLIAFNPNVCMSVIQPGLLLSISAPGDSVIESFSDQCDPHISDLFVGSPPLAESVLEPKSSEALVLEPKTMKTQETNVGIQLEYPIEKSPMVVLEQVNPENTRSTRLVPHVTKDSGGFNTQVLFENVSNADILVEIEPFNFSGEKRSRVSLMVPAGTIHSVTSNLLFEQNQDVSHFRILNEDESLLVGVSYQVADGPGSPAHIRESSLQSRGWQLFPGDWRIVFDGIAIVNAGAVPTDITVRQKDPTGRIIQSETILTNLQPMAKGLYVIGSPQDSVFTPLEGSYFEIVSQTETAITALRGTPPNAHVGFLWENVVFPIDPEPVSGILFSIDEDQEVDFNHKGIKVHVDTQMHIGIEYDDGEMQRTFVQPSASTSLVLAGEEIDEFVLEINRIMHENIETEFGVGERISLVARSVPPVSIELTLVLELYNNYPNTVLTQSKFRNLDTKNLDPEAIWTNRLYLDRKLVKSGSDSFDLHMLSMGTAWGNGTADRIWHLTSESVFANYNGGDVSNPLLSDGVGQWGGGGTPISCVWSPELAITVAVVEPELTIIGVPVETKDSGLVQIGIKATNDLGTLEPTRVLVSPRCSITVHSGDFFDGVSVFGNMLRDLGLQTRQYSEVDFQPHWDSFGLDERLDMGSAPGDWQEVERRLYIPRELGLEWIAIDSGWDNGTGSFQPNTDYYESESEFIDWIHGLHEEGFKVSLWLDPGFGDEELAQLHPDWFIYSPDGQLWMDDWERFAMDPTVEEALTYVEQGIRKMVTPIEQGGWGVDRLFLDGTFLTPPDYSGRHMSPHETECAGNEFYRRTFDVARSYNPDFPIEFCPCGAVISAWLLEFFSITSASDPDQMEYRTHEVRTKLYKALVGPDAPVNGDHIEGPGEDLDLDMKYMFPLILGVGAIYQTYFWEEEWRESDPLGVGDFNLYKKWFQLYDQLKLSQATYLNLYDLTYDQPGSHAIAKGESIFYLFTPRYGQSFTGAIELRGLTGQTYNVINYSNGMNYGPRSGPIIHLDVHIPINNPLVLKAEPVTH